MENTLPSEPDGTHLQNRPTLALVMKGGGVKGLAYVGAIAELEKYYDFNWFIGTSAGAIAAVLLASGYRTTELEEALSGKDLREFFDAGPLRAIVNLVHKGGLYEARSFTTWLDQMIGSKIKSFAPLPLNRLPRRATVYASRRYKSALVFDSQGPRDETSASFAVRCSMSIPLVFTPERDQGLRVLDGGMQNNYPVRELLGDHPDVDFIGLYLGHHFEGTPREPSLLKEMLAIWTESVDADALERYDRNTIVIDPRPIQTIDLALSPVEKDFLVATGRAAALEFLYRRNLERGPSDQEVANAGLAVTKLKAEVEAIRKKRRRRKFAGVALAAVLLGPLLVAVAVWAASRPPLPVTKVNIGNGVSLELVEVPAGTFTMGSFDQQEDEKPVHEVRISQPFALARFEVTQRQWKAVMGDNPSKFTGNDELPVEQVSWDDCQEFIRRLNELTGLEFRLPTEAEWEYACRAGSHDAPEVDVHDFAWFYENSGNKVLDETKFSRTTAEKYGNRTHEVGTREPNSWGLHDMLGNVYEWCADSYDATYYVRSQLADPSGPSSPSGLGAPSARVRRGGGWNSSSNACRPAFRATGLPAFQDHDTGLRLAVSR